MKIFSLLTLCVLLRFSIHAQYTLDETWGAADPGEEYGKRISVSTNGEVVAIAAMNYVGSAGNTAMGRVEVQRFDPSSNTWNIHSIESPGGKLTVGSTFDYFGCEIEMSKDGNVLVVGSYGVDDGTDLDLKEGAIYIYR